MAYFTPEDIQQAKQLDLLTYLQIYEPDQLVKVSGDTYCTREHDSIKISNWHEDHLLSLAGVFVTKRENVVPVALSRYLADHPEIQVLRLHLDNDAIGRGAAAGIVGGLRDRYEIWDEPPRWGKDVNDQLKIRVGLKRKEEYSR